MCQVHAGANVSLLMPGETDYSDCHPRKTTTYILHVNDKGKKRKEKEAKQDEKKKEKRRKRQENQK